MALKKTTKKTTKRTTAKSAALPRSTGAKKSTTKKVSKKTTKTNRKPTARELVCAQPEHCFWLRDGRTLDSLVALQEAFKDMDLALFKYHATGDQNDFAEWVEHILRDAECATALRKSRKPDSARTVVTRALRVYQY